MKLGTTRILLRQISNLEKYIGSQIIPIYYTNYTSQKSKIIPHFTTHLSTSYSKQIWVIMVIIQDIK